MRRIGVMSSPRRASGGGGGGVSPYSAYNLNDGSGASASSQAGGGALTLADGTWVPGKYGGGLAVANGVAASGSIFPGSAMSGFTIMAWVSLGNVSSWQSIVAGTGLNFEVSDTGHLSLYIAARTLNVTGSTALTANTWRHMAMTSTGNTGSVYVDGVVDGTATGSTGNVNPGTADVAGSHADPGTLKIDDLRVFSSVLTQAEIAAEMLRAG